MFKKDVRILEAQCLFIEVNNLVQTYSIYLASEITVV